jgi:tetratricopeptide (TPR) repeat protein
MATKMLLVVSILFFSNTAFAQIDADCEPLMLKAGGPPYNYYDTSPTARERLRLAEGSHFTKSVRMGVAGNAGSLVGDLHFVLNVFPNHPYALSVMADLQRKPGFSRQHPLRRDSYYPTINCYLLRALQIAPTDINVFLVQAIHQHKQKNYQAAKSSYLQALAIKPDAANVHYNLGLLLLQLGENSAALKHGQAAYRLGYPLPGLREKLQRLGVWQEAAEGSAALLPDSGR